MKTLATFGYINVTDSLINAKYYLAKDSLSVQNPGDNADLHASISQNQTSFHIL